MTELDSPLFAEMLGAILDGSPDLTEAINHTVGPVAANRAAIHRLLADIGAIQPIPTEPAYYEVGAADGAYLLESLTQGDHLAVLAVAVRSNLHGDISIDGHHSWSAFWPHTADAPTALKAVMMGAELILLERLGSNCVSIVDGSHATSLIALNMALANSDSRVRQQVTDRGDELVAAATYLATAPNVVACPKSDSSTDLWEQCADTLHLTGAGLTDKALAAMVLEPGEMIVAERPVPSWSRLYATQGQVSDPTGRALAARLAEAVQPLAAEPVRVHIAKPIGSSVTVRIEVNGAVDPFESADLISAVCADTAPPHLQEPVSQYLADMFAKGVSVAAEMQRATALVALAESGDPDIEYLLRSYRT